MMKNNLISDILRLKEKKNAIIAAHYYQRPEIQDIADFIGDSLALSQFASRSNAKFIILCGVKFMAETVKILNPDARVFLPNLGAGCSLADSCPKQEYEKFISKYPDAIKITYINSNIDVKIMSDIIVTSSNAERIIRSQPPDATILFAPDRHLGSYLQSISGRNMIIYPGQCHVHSLMEAETVIKLKSQYPHAKVIVHPECPDPVRKIADFIGSTSSLLNYVSKSPDTYFIVGTEIGIIHQMKKVAPEKVFINVSNSPNCACSECEFMKTITLQNILDVLENEINEIIIPMEKIEKARVPLERMLSYG